MIPPEMILVCSAAVVAGMVVGRGIAALSALMTVLMGLAGAAALSLFIVANSREGCAGGECSGAMLALLLLGPIGFGGVGLIVVGLYVMARQRLRWTGWLGRLVSILFWTLPLIALSGVALRAIEHQAEQLHGLE